MSAASLRYSKPAISTDIGATRALSSHNPASYKARGIGDHAVNDAPLSLNGFF